MSLSWLGQTPSRLGSLPEPTRFAVRPGSALRRSGGLARGGKAHAALEDTMKRKNYLTESAIFLFCDDELGFLDLL
jgi:hypothetical protein